jgi:hypothetical protein
LKGLIRVLAGAALLALGVALVLFLTDGLQFLVGELIDRVGAPWGLGVIGLVTVALAFVWIRYGGTRVLRRWGVVLKPARPEPEAVAPAADAESEPRKRLVRPQK